MRDDLREKMRDDLGLLKLLKWGKSFLKLEQSNSPQSANHSPRTRFENFMKGSVILATLILRSDLQ
jgi:hypothetical protein